MPLGGYDAESLRNDLERLGLTSRDLSAMTGVDRSTVWRWASGRTEIPTYAQTILRQASQIRTLAMRLNRVS